MFPVEKDYKSDKQERYARCVCDLARLERHISIRTLMLNCINMRFCIEY
jgi:hypothetical protein